MQGEESISGVMIKTSYSVGRTALKIILIYFQINLLFAKSYFQAMIPCLVQA